MATKEQYSVDEIKGLLYMWSGELSELVNGLGIPEYPTERKIATLKLKRVAREIDELLTETEGLKNVKTS
jgi:hypothetical protein